MNNLLADRRADGSFAALLSQKPREAARRWPEGIDRHDLYQSQWV